MRRALRTYGVLVFPSLAVVAIVADHDGPYGWIGWAVLVTFNFVFGFRQLRRRRQRRLAG